MVELLVTISVIGVLLAILIPALAGARSSARSVGCLSNLRGVGQVVEHYLHSYGSRYPFAVGDRWVFLGPEEDGEGGSIMYGNHFTIEVYWVGLMHDVAPWRRHFATWVCPGSPRISGAPWLAVPGTFASGIGQPSYRYASGFVASPALWGPGANADPLHLRAVGAHEVLFPSSKTLMWDAERAHASPRQDPDPTLQLFADGHAAVHRVSAASPPVLNPFTTTTRPLADTADGVRGRDYP